MQEKITPNSVFSDRLKSLMKSRGYTQDSLSQALNLSQTTVWRWLKGALPAADLAVRLATLLGTTVEKMVSEKPDDSSVDQRVILPDSEKEKALRDLTRLHLEMGELLRKISKT